MSLFRAREWWSVHLGNSEDFDNGCMSVGSLEGKSSKYQQQIFVGSHSGMLRVYQPNGVSVDIQENSSKKGSAGFRADHLLLEQQLSSPILQVLIGRFITSSGRFALAVLHPRKLSVYGLVQVAGTVTHGVQFSLQAVYEHSLQRTAFNMCIGPFGGVQERDFICVQSVDCTFTVYEQESCAFQRFLPKSMLPGPLVYVPRTDCLVTVSSTRCLEAYRYQVLAVATETKTKEESQNIKQGKRVLADWAFNLGETATDLQLLSIVDDSFLLVLTLRHVMCVTEIGKLHFSRRLEVPTAALHAYKISDKDSIQYLVATCTGQIFVYKNVELLWAVAWSQTPVSLMVANFEGLSGLITALSDSGHLDCLYLGTDPSLPQLPPSNEIRDNVDYEDQDTELQKLQDRIKQASSSANAPIPSAKDFGSDLQVEVQLPRSLDYVSKALSDSACGSVPSFTATLVLKPRAALHNVQVGVEVHSPLGASQSSMSFAYIDTTHPGNWNVSFFMKHQSVPSELEIQVVATYCNIQGIPRVGQVQFSVPLNLVVQACVPVKVARYKLTIDSNKPPANLDELFPDFTLAGMDSQGCALGFQVYGEGPVVTILASKTSQRYRVQSDNFAAMWLPTRELTRRLQRQYGSTFQFSFSGAPPIAHFCEILQDHFVARVRFSELEESLKQRTSQFRAIQKRLLTRFKDKTPQPLLNLDVLLENCLRQILQMSDTIEDERLVVQQHGTALRAAIQLLCFANRYSGTTSEENAAIFEQVLSAKLQDFPQLGIEEQLDIAITHVLRTVLARSARDVQLNTAELKILENTDRLEKHVGMLVERLGKGVQVSDKRHKAKIPSLEVPSVSGDSTMTQDKDMLDSHNQFQNFRPSKEKKHKKKKQPKVRDTMETLDNNNASFYSQDEK